MVEAQPLPLRAQLVRQFRHPVVEARHGDAAGVIVERREDARQHPDRVHGGAAELARMQVLVGAGDRDLLAQQAAQAGGDRRHPIGEEAGVADQRELGAQLLGILLQEGDERGRARFLLALEEQGQLAGKLPVHRLPGAAGLDEGHQLPLVVGGAARADDLALRGVLEFRVERVAVPEVERVHRLHVVMAVEQQVPPAFAAMAHHHRVAGRVAARGVEAQRGEVVHQPVGGAAHIGGIGRVGRDRGDAQKLHQPGERGVQVRVDAGQHGVEDRVGCGVGGAHGGVSCPGCGMGATVAARDRLSSGWPCAPARAISRRRRGRAWGRHSRGERA